MLWTIFVILLVLWLLGVVSSYTLGGFIHILLVIALVVLVIQLISGRQAGGVKMQVALPIHIFALVSEGAPRRTEDKIHGGGIMNKDQVKGAVNDAAGRAKRQVGEWTGNTETQAEGTAQQVKGKVQKAWGNVKEAAKDAQTDAEREREHPHSAHNH